MSQLDRATMLEVISRNIRTSGFHIYVVGEGTIPRFAYTIGLSESIGAELAFPGAIYYVLEEVNTILHTIRERLMSSGNFDSDIEIDSLGSFTLREAHVSWIQHLLLGAMDYYKSGEIRAYQIMPDPYHWTIDIPDMAKEWSATAEPVWRWLYDEWTLPVPRTSNVTTNLDALRGARITEVARWGEDEWEMFAGAGEDVSYEEARVVPLGCVLGADPSLAQALDLEVGRGLLRDSEGDWHPWSRTTKKDPD